MKPRNILIVLISLLVAILVANGANKWIEKRLTATAQSTETVPVVAAATDIPVGTKLDLSHVKVLQVSPEYAPENGYSELEAVVGNVAKQGLYKGEIIVKPRIEEDVSGSRLAALISEGMRAITVKVDAVTGVAGFLHPGSRVDLIAVGRGNAKTILQDLKILAVGTQVETKEGGAVKVATITLEVDPRQAEIVAKAGKLRLTLRNPLDRDQVEPPQKQVTAAEPTTKDEPRKRQILFAVDVVRGTNVSTTTVEERVDE